MIERYHVPIYALISERGALGVNTIAKETGFPLSTVQKYLSAQQNYFRKTPDRKWDLPEKVNADITDSALVLTVSLIESTILLMQTQLAEVQSTLGNALTPLSTLKKGIENKPAPVADVPQLPKNEKLRKILEETDKLPEVIKSKKENLSEEMYKMLLNTNFLELILDMGDNYVGEVVTPELFDLLLGTKDELSDDVLNNLKDYQK